MQFTLQGTTNIIILHYILCYQPVEALDVETRQALLVPRVFTNPSAVLTG